MEPCSWPTHGSHNISEQCCCEMSNKGPATFPRLVAGPHYILNLCSDSLSPVLPKGNPPWVCLLLFETICCYFHMPELQFPIIMLSVCFNSVWRDNLPSLKWMTHKVDLRLGPSNSALPELLWLKFLFLCHPRKGESVFQCFSNVSLIYS